MSEVKFACPYCAQHIACDDAYCGNAIVCPACSEKIFVPRLSAFTQSDPGKLKLALPVAPKTEFVPRVAAPDVWSQQQWDQHLAEVTGEQPEMQPIIWFFVAASPFFSLALAFRGVGFAPVATCFILSALLAGFAWAWSRSLRGFRLALVTVAAAVTVLAGYGCLAVAILVAGCGIL
jgi:hypothetical protein